MSKLYSYDGNPPPVSYSCTNKKSDCGTQTEDPEDGVQVTPGKLRKQLYRESVGSVAPSPTGAVLDTGTQMNTYLKAFV